MSDLPATMSSSTSPPPRRPPPTAAITTTATSSIIPPASSTSPPPSAASPSSSSSSSLPSWHFPFGPSSRYHQREKSTPLLRRNGSAYAIGAPVLSTERRAHRRAHTQKSSISSLPSPPGSDASRSPLSRFASYHHSNIAAQFSPAKMAAPNGAMLFTPAKSHSRGSSLQNSSPFSDYYTDEARSVDIAIPESETKQLLVRMNKLQAHLMREHQFETGQSRESFRIIGRKLSEVECELQALHSHARRPVDMGEADFSAEETDSVAKRNRHSLCDSFLSDEYTGVSSEPVTAEQFKAERDWFIMRTQELLRGLETAQTELSVRFHEVRALNERHNAQIEERETELEQLRSENECLKSDLGFEYSELLFLKLQMKSMEVDLDALADDFDVPDSAATRDRRAKKNRILSELDRWRNDWQDVDRKSKRRRGKYGVSPDSGDSASRDGSSPQDDEIEWHLETVNEGRGGVTSLTIKRMDSSVKNTSAAGARADHDADSTFDANIHETAKTATPLTASVGSGAPRKADNDKSAIPARWSGCKPDEEEVGNVLYKRHPHHDSVLDGRSTQHGPREPHIATHDTHSLAPLPSPRKAHGIQPDHAEEKEEEEEEGEGEVDGGEVEEEKEEGEREEEEEEEIFPQDPQGDGDEEEIHDQHDQLSNTDRFSFYHSQSPHPPMSVNPLDISSDQGCVIASAPDISGVDEQDAPLDDHVEEADQCDAHIEEEISIPAAATTTTTTTPSRPKTAWAELWDSLAALSGMGDDHEEEDEE